MSVELYLNLVQVDANIAWVLKAHSRMGCKCPNNLW